MKGNELVRLSQAARELDLSEWTLLRWARQGRLGARKLPTGGWRFSRTALEEFKRGGLTQMPQKEVKLCNK